jgi:rubrerythrin
MEDITSCELDAVAFAGSEEAAVFFTKLADEKRARLPELGRIFKEGTGFRQRRNEVSRSVEAALRNRATRAEKSVTVYLGLNRLMKKPEFKEVMRGLANRELEILGQVKKLQASLKKPS